MVHPGLWKPNPPKPMFVDTKWQNRPAEIHKQEFGFQERMD
jgi:hypothetical protein